MAAANRDPMVFSEPDCFDLDRKKDESLTFGRGIKACPGMHLARKKHDGRASGSYGTACLLWN